MFRMMGLLSIVGTAIFANPSAEGANPALHTLAGIFEHDDGSLGALARLYNQIDQIADGDNHYQNDDLIDDTRTIGAAPKLYSSNLGPELDPAYHYKNETKPKEEEIVRPEDPVFRKPGFKRHDRTSQVKTPVWGIVTEPIKGKIDGGWTEYIPSSHVKFLEQTGAKVIAISYNIDKNELYRLLDQVSGVYLHGESIEAPKLNKFQATFGLILAYAFEHNHDKNDYFPVFMLGSTLQTFLQNRLAQDVLPLSNVPSYLFNKNVKLRATIDPSKSFILDEISKDNVDEMIHAGSYFNR